MAMFVLVFSLWGFNGEDWVYIGNQYIYNEPMPIDTCMFIAHQSNWYKYETNENYRLSVECKPAIKKTGTI
tara:strand:- start:1370 stop:1582 length:213 start_codon:yes stop_codon:yes gene_type:complete